MPSTYVRESQALSLEHQEKMIRFLRDGGEVRPLDAHPLMEVGLPASSRGRLTRAAPRIRRGPAAEKSPRCRGRLAGGSSGGVLVADKPCRSR